MDCIAENADGRLEMQESTLFDKTCVRLDLCEVAKKKFLKLVFDGSGFLEKNEWGEVLKIRAKMCDAKRETPVLLWMPYSLLRMLM